MTRATIVYSQNTPRPYNLTYAADRCQAGCWNQALQRWEQCRNKPKAGEYCHRHKAVTK